jgi:hypothetical protein
VAGGVRRAACQCQSVASPHDSSRDATPGSAKPWPRRGLLQRVSLVWRSTRASRRRLRLPFWSWMPRPRTPVRCSAWTFWLPPAQFAGGTGLQKSWPKVPSTGGRLPATRPGVCFSASLLGKIRMPRCSALLLLRLSTRSSCRRRNETKRNETRRQTFPELRLRVEVYPAQFWGTLAFFVIHFTTISTRASGSTANPRNIF